MTAQIPPTGAHAETLEAIQRLTVNNVPPSFRELADDLGLRSLSNLHVRLNRMKERGLIAFEFGRARTLRVVEPAQPVDLKSMTGVELVALRGRIEAELIARWQA